MGKDTKIGWCHHTINPWWGCQEVHAGCDHCYAKTWDKRMGGDHWGAHATRRAIKSVWSDLAQWQADAKAAGEQRRVFCGSMMDIFEVSKPLVDHKGNPISGETKDLRDRLFNEIVPASPNLLFLFLTKRPQNILKMIPPTWILNSPANIMYGYSPVDQETADQGIGHLLKVPGRHFLSVEPLLGPVDLWGARYPNPNGGFTGAVTNWPGGANWVIVGGESGPGCRPMDLAWARQIRDDCAAAHVPYFFKQIGGHPHKGEDLESIPDDLRIRQFPERVFA